MKANEKINDLIKSAIKKAIKDKELTVAEVAARMGVKGPALSQVINGNPTIDMLDRIAKALDIDIIELFNNPSNDVFGLIEYKGKSYRIESTESLKQLLLIIEANNITEK